MKLKKVIAAVTAAAVAIGSFTAYSIVSPKFSLSAETSPERGKITVHAQEGLTVAFYDRTAGTSEEPIEPIEGETNEYAVDANTEILAVVTLPELLEDGKKLYVSYGVERKNFFENDRITFSFSFTMSEKDISVLAWTEDLGTPDNSGISPGSSEDLTIDIDEENKITGNDVIQAGGEVKPGETVDITNENSNASASVKLPDTAESGLSFIITNKTDEIINSANRILSEAAKITAEKAKAIKSAVENILNNKNKGFAYELKFTDSSGSTVKVEGSFVKAALPIPENLLPKNNSTPSFFVYHVTPSGLEKINSIFNAANNTVEFAATSFSPYLITLEEITGDALDSTDNGSAEPENTTSVNSSPDFAIPSFTLSSAESNGTGAVTAAPIPTASFTTAASTTVPPAASNAPAASSPEASETPAYSADNMGKPDNENAADTTGNSSSTSSMGIDDTNAATGLALELVPLLAVTAIGVYASMKKK